ncbi:MAG: acyltransferase [Bacteroidaceae bacterium]
MAYFVFCLLHIKKWKQFFDTYENQTALNRVQFFKTIYFNYRSLPGNQAKLFPIYIYSDVEIISSSGRISLECDTIQQGMIRWGWFYSFRSQGVSRINNQGLIKIYDGGGRFLRGSEITVRKGACLSIGRNFFVGENTSIYCWHEITLGKFVRLTYQSQIFDTDFHYSVNSTTGEVKQYYASIRIGDYNWIGNRATIKKGTITPDHLTVAAPNSMLGKDYSSLPPYSIIGGSPAKLLKTGYSRIWNNEMQRIAEIEEWYKQNPEGKTFSFDLSEMPLEEITEEI